MEAAEPSELSPPTEQAPLPPLPLPPARASTDLGAPADPPAALESSPDSPEAEAEAELDQAALFVPSPSSSSLSLSSSSSSNATATPAADGPASNACALPAEVTVLAPSNEQEQPQQQEQEMANEGSTPTAFPSSSLSSSPPPPQPPAPTQRSSSTLAGPNEAQPQEQVLRPTPVEQEGEGPTAPDGDGTEGGGSDADESAAAAAEDEAEGHIEEGGADGADSQVFQSIDLSASPAAPTSLPSKHENEESSAAPEEQPMLQEEQDDAQEHSIEQRPVEPEQLPAHEEAPPPPEPDGVVRLDIVEPKEEATAMLKGEVSADVAAASPPVIVDVVLAEGGQHQQGQEDDGEGKGEAEQQQQQQHDEEKEREDQLALAAAALGSVPSLPRPRVVPSRLQIPTATPTTTTAPAPYPATPARQAPPPNWPLFHSPRAGPVPLSPSPVTGAPLLPPTAAGHAHLEAQPSQDDGYEDERLGDDFLASSWLPPSHNRAKRYHDANIFREGRAPILPMGLCGNGRSSTSGSGAGHSPAPSPTPPDDETVGEVEAACAQEQAQAQAPPPPSTEDQRDLGADGEGEQERADLSELGVGVLLHFKLLKALLLGFLLLIVLHLPAVFLYRSGTRFSRDKADVLGFYVFTLGNMGNDLLWDGGDDVSLALRFPGLGISWSLSPHDAAVVLASMEVASSIVFAFLVGYMWWLIDHAKRRHKRRVLSTKDFAVFVTNLPKLVTKAEVIDHFSDLYPLDRPDWKGRPPPPTTGRSKRPVADLAHVGGDRRYEGKWVAEVVIARRNGRILQTALRHKDNALEIRRLRARMKRYGPTTAPQGGADPALFQRYQRQLDQLEARMRRVAHQLERDPYVSRAGQESVGAFVLFEYPESARRCLDDHNSMNLLHLCCFPNTLLFNGRHRLKVCPAPAPDDVMWQNLELPELYRFGRRLVVNVLTLLILVVSFALIIALTQQKTQLAKQLPDLNLCSREIPALYMGGDYGRVNASLQLVGPGEREEAESRCEAAVPGATSVYAVYSYHNQHTLPVADYAVGQCNTVGPCPRPDGPQCPCLLADTSSSSDPTCETVRCLGLEKGGPCKQFPYSLITSCFCLARLQDLVKGGISSAVLIGWEFKLPACQTMANSLIWSASVQVLLSLLTLGISIYILPPAVKTLTAWERHHSADREASHVLMRLFSAQFLNVGILLLIVYGGHPSIQPSPTASNAAWARVMRAMGIFAGPYQDMYPDWYAVVGTQLYLNALICALSPHVWPLLQYLVLAPMQRQWAVLFEAWYHKPRFAMQWDLNALYVGPAFDITTRTAQALTVIFLALLFSPGLPLMPALAALAFFFSYAVDYCLLLRFYQRPPQRDERLHLKLCQCLPYALFLKLSMAIWMLSSKAAMHRGGSRNDDSAAFIVPADDAGISAVERSIERVTQPHIRPLFLLWVLNLFYLVLLDVLPSRQVTALLARINAAIQATCCAVGGSGARSHRRRRISSEPAMHLDVLNDNGFSKVFERPLPLDRLAPGPIPPHQHSPRGDAGWHEVYNEQNVPVLRKLREKIPCVSSPASPRGGTAGPAAYRRTWEMLRASGPWSYELHRSPRYRDAVLAFAREFCPPATSKVGKSLRGSYWGGQGAWRPTVVVPRVDEEAVLREQAREEEEEEEEQQQQQGIRRGVEAHRVGCQANEHV